MVYQSRKKFIKSIFYIVISWLNSSALAKIITTKLNISTESTEKLKIATTKRIVGMDSSFTPAYIKLFQTGELKKRGEKLWDMMQECKLCPRECGVNRLNGEEGFCQASSKLKIASFHAHYGEERSLVGRGGSGTVFFTNCSLRCVFCINYDISQEGAGDQKSFENLASMMLRLQDMGCHNINVVTPTHYSAYIILALNIASKGGLKLPLVYNTCGWEKVEILKLLDGIVDIYLPDIKYSDSEIASDYSSGADTYPELTKMALMEMNRQVGVAKPANDGLMYKGLMIRHLVMPNNVSGSKQIFQWIAEKLSKDTYVNIMSQYRPVYKAFEFQDIARRITSQEYNNAIEWAKKAGLTNLDIQN
jgi:putative pyruvate formate lyase activating enzyme